MNYRIVCGLMFLIGALQLTEIAAQKKQPRVVILGFDGLSIDGYKTAKHPNLDTLFADGVLSLSTRSVMPSVTLPNWTSHLTGSGPEEHGVTDNSWTVDKNQLKAIDTDKDGYYPSIFKLLKEKVPGAKSAYYYNWPELINSMNRKCIDAISFQWNDRYDSNYNRAFDFILQNKSLPTFVFLYSVHTDHAGHKFNWMSPQYISAIESADEMVGTFIHQLKSEKLYNDTHFILITDHGGIKAGHGGTSMDEMLVPWAATGPQIKKMGISGLYNSNKNTALVVARIFGIKQNALPKSWTGSLPEGIFK